MTIFTHVCGWLDSWEKGEFIRWWAGRNDFDSS